MVENVLLRGEKQPVLEITNGGRTGINTLQQLATYLRLTTKLALRHIVGYAKFMHVLRDYNDMIKIYLLLSRKLEISSSFHGLLPKWYHSLFLLS